MTRPDPGILPLRSKIPVFTGWLASAAASLAFVASFLPWGRSGQTSRSSYQLVGVADRLDVLDGSARTAAMAWFVLPVLVGLVWLARSVDRHGTAATLSALTGLLSVVAAALIERSPLAVEHGATLAKWTGAVAVAAAIAHLSTRRSTRSDD